jgi:hypothetical protein
VVISSRSSDLVDWVSEVGRDLGGFLDHSEILSREKRETRAARTFSVS